MQNTNAEFRFRNQYSKLHIFNMIEYGTIVYMDTDVYVLRPAYELFQLPPEFPFAAVLDNEYVIAQCNM